MRRHNTIEKSNVGGVILVVIGALLLLNNFDMIPEDLRYYAFNWRGIMVVLGIVLISLKKNKTSGYILLTIGTLFILSRLSEDYYGHIDNFKNIFWSLALIAIGVYLITKRKTKNKPKTNNGSSPDYLDDTIILGGGDVIVESEQFQGGRITALFGGSSYDLTRSNLAHIHNSLEVFAMFGGVSFTVPSNWNIQLEVTLP